MPALDHVNKDGTIYEIVPEIAPLFNTLTDYAAGDCVIKDAVLYRFKTAHAAGAWVGTDAEAIEVGEELTQLNKIPTGTHPDMTAGNADQLVSTVFVEDEVPYNFRTSGGSADIGDREYDEIVGGSIVLNQLTSNDTQTQTVNGVTFTKSDGKYVVSGTASGNAFIYSDYGSANYFAKNHVYMFSGCPANGSGSTYRLGLVGAGTTVASEYGSGGLYKYTSDTATILSTVIYIYSGYTASNLTFTPQVFDLTQMFGSAIVDYVYGLEQSTVGSGVTWLKHHFPKIFDAGYIPYNAGEMQSVTGLSAHKMTGFNQWDEEWESGMINSSTGQPTNDPSYIRSKNYNPCLGGQTYCNSSSAEICFFFYDANKNYLKYQWARSGLSFAFPDSARYFKIMPVNSYGTVYNHDFCINLHWDGERDGEYEAYKEYEYALDDSVVLRGILKLDSNSQLYADGDRYLPDGTVQRRYGVVDLGTLNWVKQIISSDTFFQSDGLRGVIKPPVNNSTIADCVCPVFKFVPWNSSERGNFICAIAGATDSYAGRISCQYSAASTVEEFKSAMSGVYMVYPLATPTTETAEPYQTPQIVDDWGTEEYISTSLVPVGHDTKYANNLRAKLEMSPDSPEEDGDYIVRHGNGENEYVALGSTTTIQGILDRLTALENA